jgi:FixJ family two-component response regulator
VAAPASLILDDDEDLRLAMQPLIELLTGRPCLAVGGLDELIRARDAVLGCQAALLDINLGVDRPSGLDAYDWLMGERFAGRIAFLTGHARSHPLVARAAHIGPAQVFSKPISADELRRFLCVAPRTAT